MHHSKVHMVGSKITSLALFVPAVGNDPTHRFAQPRHTPLLARSRSKQRRDATQASKRDRDSSYFSSGVSLLSLLFPFLSSSPLSLSLSHSLTFLFLFPLPLSFAYLHCCSSFSSSFFCARDRVRANFLRS